MIPGTSRLWSIRYFQDYLEVLDRVRFPIERCCLCGSTSLAVWGLRENEDVDFICDPELAARMGFKGDNTYFLGDDRKVALIPTRPPHFPVAFHGMTFRLGHSVLVDGFRVATLEDSYLFKCAWLFHGLENNDAKVKDAEDVCLLNAYFEHSGYDRFVLSPDLWHGGQVWKIGHVSVKLPSPFRLKAYNPADPKRMSRLERIECA